MLKDIIKNNRSYRRFDENVEIENSLLVSFIDDARFTPSARNQQALVFKVISEKEDREKLFPLLKWAGYLKDWDGPVDGEKPTGYIVIGIKKEHSSNYINDWTYTDLGISAQTILLLAAEAGFGGCMIAAINRNKIVETFGIPENIEIMMVLAIGKPNEKVVVEEKSNLEDIKYYRKEDVHYVPKRTLKDILL
ncbi:MAG: nitroreductase family protein [Bacteroidales bacterium]|nr:nitroreductase family protein [Bacteroidales bacterium]